MDFIFGAPAFYFLFINPLNRVMSISKGTMQLLVSFIK